MKSFGLFASQTKDWFFLRLEFRILDLASRVRGISDQPRVNRHPNLVFIGGSVIIAIVVMAALAEVANACCCSYSKSKSAEATTEEINGTFDQKVEVEA